MTTSAYQKALDTAIEEIAALTAQCSELQRRISRLQAAADALMALMDLSSDSENSAPEREEEVGINEAIRQVLRTSPVPLTSPEIKEKLAERGFDEGLCTTDMSIVDSTLKRLEQQGHVSLIGTVYLAVSL